MYKNRSFPSTTSRTLKAAAEVSFSICALLSIPAGVLAQDAGAFSPDGPPIYFTFNNYIGSFYVSTVVLQPTVIQELCIVGPCLPSRGVGVTVSGNSPSCPDPFYPDLDAWVSVTFRSQDNQAYFTRSFRFVTDSDQGVPFSRYVHVDGYFGDLATGTVNVETSASCISSLLF